MNYNIITYETGSGKIPLDDWLNKLDVRQVAIIALRIDKLERGIFGDHEPVGSGVYELIYMKVLGLEFTTVRLVQQ